MEIRFLERSEIEPRKWDGCVYYSLNSRMYAYTWYLDNICENWAGLVEGDYESVFPIVWNTKLLGFKQIYQPYLCQQLGVFSMYVCSQPRLEAFIRAIPKEFRLVDMQLNFANHQLPALSEYKFTSRPNFVLNLARPYEQIQAGYSQNLRRNLKKAQKSNLFLSTDIRPELFLDNVKQYHLDKKNGIPESVYHAASRIIYNCFHRGQGVIFGVYDADKRLYAAAFILFDGSRLVNLLNISTDLGRAHNAMGFLFDNIIRTHAGQLKVLDFEGSSIPGIAQFYQSFGSENQPFAHIYTNQLPWWIRWAKPNSNPETPQIQA